MSIVGIGHDEVEIDRIRAVLARHGERFLKRCYSEEELRFCLVRKDPAPGLAARYAAKEAGAKALGTGIARGVVWKDIEVRRQRGQRPTLHLHGRAAEIAAQMGVTQMHLTLTHTTTGGHAVVILERA